MVSAKLSDKKLRQFIKAGGRNDAKPDFDKILKKAGRPVDKKR